MTDKLNERLRQLTDALKRLEPEVAGGPQARRNARNRVLTVLRLVRQYVEEYHPVERRAPKPRRKRVAKPWRAERLVFVATPIAQKLAAAGVRLKLKDTRAAIPGWAYDLIKLDPTIAQLREANRSMTARRALLAEAMLMAEPTS
jgi:hypothetical protein